MCSGMPQSASEAGSAQCDPLTCSSSQPPSLTGRERLSQRQRTPAAAAAASLSASEAQRGRHGFTPLAAPNRLGERPTGHHESLPLRLPLAVDGTIYRDWQAVATARCLSTHAAIPASLSPQGGSRYQWGAMPLAVDHDNQQSEILPPLIAAAGAAAADSLRSPGPATTSARRNSSGGFQAPQTVPSMMPVAGSPRHAVLGQHYPAMGSATTSGTSRLSQAGSRTLAMNGATTSLKAASFHGRATGIMIPLLSATPSPAATTTGNHDAGVFLPLRTPPSPSAPGPCSSCRWPDEGRTDGDEGLPAGASGHSHGAMRGCLIQKQPQPQPQQQQQQQPMTARSLHAQRNLFASDRFLLREESASERWLTASVKGEVNRRNSAHLDRPRHTYAASVSPPFDHFSFSFPSAAATGRPSVASPAATTCSSTTAGGTARPNATLASNRITRAASQCPLHGRHYSEPRTAGTATAGKKAFSDNLRLSVPAQPEAVELQRQQSARLRVRGVSEGRMHRSSVDPSYGYASAQSPTQRLGGQGQGMPEAVAVATPAAVAPRRRSADAEREAPLPTQKQWQQVVTSPRIAGAPAICSPQQQPLQQPQQQPQQQPLQQPQPQRRLLPVKSAATVQLNGHNDSPRQSPSTTSLSAPGQGWGQLRGITNKETAAAVTAPATRRRLESNATEVLSRGNANATLGNPALIRPVGMNPPSPPSPTLGAACIGMSTSGRWKGVSRGDLPAGDGTQASNGSGRGMVVSSSPTVRDFLGSGKVVLPAPGTGLQQAEGSPLSRVIQKLSSCSPAGRGRCSTTPTTHQLSSSAEGEEKEERGRGNNRRITRTFTMSSCDSASHRGRTATLGGSGTRSSPAIPYSTGLEMGEQVAETHNACAAAGGSVSVSGKLKQLNRSMSSIPCRGPVSPTSLPSSAMAPSFAVVMLVDAMLSREKAAGERGAIASTTGTFSGSHGIRRMAKNASVSGGEGLTGDSKEGSNCQRLGHRRCFSTAEGSMQEGPGPTYASEDTENYSRQGSDQCESGGLGVSGVGSSAWQPPHLCPYLSAVAVAAGHLPETQRTAVIRSPSGRLRLHGRTFHEFQVRESPVPVVVVGEPGGNSKRMMADRQQQGSQGGEYDGIIAVGQAMQVLLVGLHQCSAGKVLIATAADGSITRRQVLERLQEQQLLDGGKGCEGWYENQMSASVALEYVQRAHSLWVKQFAMVKPPVERC